MIKLNDKTDVLGEQLRCTILKVLFDSILNNQLDYVCNRMKYAPVQNCMMKSFIMCDLHQIYLLLE
jgi:hypothetical protein